MREKKQNLYEGMYILSVKLSDDARQKALDRILKGITERGGTIQKIHDQGRRRLAYEINGHREGYYYVIYFNLLPSIVVELWNDYHLHEDLIRFLTLQVDEVMEKIQFKPIEVTH